MRRTCYLYKINKEIVNNSNNKTKKQTNFSVFVLLLLLLVLVVIHIPINPFIDLNSRIETGQINENTFALFEKRLVRYLHSVEFTPKNNTIRPLFSFFIFVKEND